MSPTTARPARESKGRREKVRARQAAQRRAQRRRVIVGSVVGVVLVAAVVVGLVLGLRSEPTNVVPPKAASGSGIALGQSTAPVLVDIYEDFQCPSCKVFESSTGSTIEQLMQAGKIRVVYHQFAFLGPESVRASNAASCASDEGKFLPFHDVLYANQPAEHTGGYTNAQLVSYGKTVGLTSSAFTSCVKDGRYTAWVQQARDDVSKAGVTATPTVKMNGKEVDRSVLVSPEAFTAAVDNLTKK